MHKGTCLSLSRQTKMSGPILLGYKLLRAALYLMELAEWKEKFITCFLVSILDE